MCFTVELAFRRRRLAVDLVAVTHTAIGQFSGELLALANVELLTNVGLAQEGAGFGRFSRFDSGEGSVVGLAEERELHGGAPGWVGRLRLMSLVSGSGLQVC